jgi:hypothetical protein
MGKGQKKRKRGSSGQPSQQQPLHLIHKSASILPAAAAGNGHGRNNYNDQRGRRCNVDQAMTTDSAADGDDNDIISSEDLAVTIRTIERLTRTMRNTTTAGGVVVAGPGGGGINAHNKELYRRLRASLHPLVVAQMKKYDRPIDYRNRTSEYLKSRRYADAYAALCACRDWDQIPLPGMVQRYVSKRCICWAACFFAF